MNVVEPSVSTASRLRTSTWRLAICSAPQASDNVTVGSSASGTRATVTPIANTNPSVGGLPSSSASAKNSPPTPTAMAAIVRTTRWSSTRQRAGRSHGRRGQPGDLRQPGRSAGRRGHRVGLALDHERAGVHHVADTDREGLALAGEQRGVDAAGIRRSDGGIGRDAVAGLEHEHVVDDDLGGVDLDPPAAPPDGDAPRQQGPQPLGGAVGPVLLHEREHGVEHDDREDGDRQLGQAGDDASTPATHSITAKKWTSWRVNRSTADGLRGDGSSFRPSAARRAAASDGDRPEATTLGGVSLIPRHHPSLMITAIGDAATLT